MENLTSISGHLKENFWVILIMSYAKKMNLMNLLKLTKQPLKIRLNQATLAFADDLKALILNTSNAEWMRVGEPSEL